MQNTFRENQTKQHCNNPKLERLQECRLCLMEHICPAGARLQRLLSCSSRQQSTWLKYVAKKKQKQNLTETVCRSTSAQSCVGAGNRHSSVVTLSPPSEEGNGPLSPGSSPEPRRGAEPFPVHLEHAGAGGESSRNKRCSCPEVPHQALGTRLSRGSAGSRRTRSLQPPRVPASQLLLPPTSARQSCTIIRCSLGL